MAESKATAAKSTKFSYVKGDEVDALYRGEWYPARIVGVADDLLHVIYIDFEDDGSYPVSHSSVRLKGGKPPASFPDPKVWETELESAKESGLPGTFFASIPGPPIMDRMTNLGIYAIPTVGFYPYMTQFEIQPKCIIEAPGENIRLPQEIYMEFLEREISEFQFFFAVNDISQVVHNQKAKKPLNLINHTWIHPMIEMGSKLGYGEKWFFGCYAYENSGVSHVENKCDLTIQTLAKYEVHIHPQKGGMCLSPNNGKFMVNREIPICYFWSVAIQECEKPKHPRCSVTLHWLLCERWQKLDALCQSSTTISDLLGAFNLIVNKESNGALAALLFNFGFTDTWPYKPKAVQKKAPPKKKQQNKNTKGKIQCDRCGKMLGGNLEAHQNGKKCKEAFARLKRQRCQIVNKDD